jgi:hypothetical protein
MTGCPLACACFVACRLGELSQHKVAPQVWHVRKCIQGEPIFTHSSHCRRFGCVTVVISAMWGQDSLGISYYTHIFFRDSCTNWMLINPSPTAEVTRLTGPERTSPETVTVHEPGSFTGDADHLGNPFSSPQSSAQVRDLRLCQLWESHRSQIVLRHIAI